MSVIRTELKRLNGDISRTFEEWKKCEDLEKKAELYGEIKSMQLKRGWLRELLEKERCDRETRVNTGGRIK